MLFLDENHHHDVIFLARLRMKDFGSSPLTLNDIDEIIFRDAKISIAPSIIKKIAKNYEAVQIHAESKQRIYGLNTGFGALAETLINVRDQKTLQKNIILSHAVGVGSPLDFVVAKALMLLRLNTLLQGYSGASPDLIHHLMALLNANCAPLIPKKGSVGASGDLAPLAHLGLLLLGIGDAFFKGQVITAKTALEHASLSPLELGIRDGLALINGTQAMTAVAVIALKLCFFLLDLADINAASTLEALGGHLAPFDERIQQIKPHPGQIMTARNVRNAVRGRKAEKFIKNLRTQDPYSIRCVPQVHGASKDVVNHAKEVTEREINAVTDNPLIFIDEAYQNLTILSGGNFHGQHMALVLDYLAMAMAELANIAERRIELLLNPAHSNGLPPFLIQTSGLNSGYMMLHVTATALVNENKILCHPASIDSIPTSANREDHVSMGMTAANKLLTIIENTKIVLGIELLAAHQGIDFRSGGFLGVGIEKIHHALRNHVPFRKQDDLYKDDLTSLFKWLDTDETQQLMKKILND